MNGLQDRHVSVCAYAGSVVFAGWALLITGGLYAQEENTRDVSSRAGQVAPADTLETAATNTAVVATAPREVGLRITHVQTRPRDAKTATITFDISWGSSWRWGVFHDAAWVFFKVPADSMSGWRHVRLVADKVLNPAGYTQEKGGTPLEFVVPDGDEGFTGVFIRRAADGVGPVSAKGVTVLCEVQSPDTLLRASGLEMVYVPEGPFYVGLGAEEPVPSAGYGFGGMEQNWLYQYTRSDGRDFVASFDYSRIGGIGDLWAIGGPEYRLPAYRVNSAGPIPTGRQKGSLWAVDIKPEDKGEIPAAFPNGYAAFYCMKRPGITQGQYADFLNTLTAAQAKPRYWIEGHGVDGSVPAVRRLGKAPDYTYAATNPDAPCPWISWQDAMIYGAWSGLRPMTELEFEKMLRGPEFAQPNDASPSYWGVDGVQQMAMIERTISIGDAVGRAFKGSHGRGTLEPPADWPAKLYEGVVLRGDAVPYAGAAGSRPFTPTHLLIAGRTFPLFPDLDQCHDTFFIWRGARSAPAPAGTTIPGKAASDTAMAPFKIPEPRTYPLGRMKQPMTPDGVLSEWEQDKPTLTLTDPSQILPNHMRMYSAENTNAWRGVDDLSAKVWLGWDGEAVCVAAEVRDDVPCNTNAVRILWDGDSMNFGLIDADANQTDIWLALTADGVVLNPLADPTERLAKLAKAAAVRDEAARITRYELRVPLAGLLLKTGAECCFYLRFFDSDGKPAQYRIQLAPVITDPFKAKLYSKFVLVE